MFFVVKAEAHWSRGPDFINTLTIGAHFQVWASSVSIESIFGEQFYSNPVVVTRRTLSQLQHTSKSWDHFFLIDLILAWTFVLIQCSACWCYCHGQGSRTHGSVLRQNDYNWSIFPSLDINSFLQNLFLPNHLVQVQCPSCWCYWAGLGSLIRGWLAGRGLAIKHSLLVYA